MSETRNININTGGESPDQPGIEHRINYDLGNGVSGTFTQRGLDRKQLRKGIFEAPRTGHLRIAIDLNWAVLGLVARQILRLYALPGVGSVIATSLIIAEGVLIIALLIWATKEPDRRMGRALEILSCILFGFVCGYYQF